MTKATQQRRRGGNPGVGCTWVLLLGLLTFLAGADLACKKSAPTSKGPGKDSNASQVKGVLHLESFVVNLADSEDSRYLRVGIDLGLEIPVPAKEGKGGEGEVPLARVRDSILAVLSTWHSDALLAPEGKQKLKDELVHALRERVPELRVKEVYFTDFLVQR